MKNEELLIEHFRRKEEVRIRFRNQNKIIVFLNVSTLFGSYFLPLCCHLQAVLLPAAAAEVAAAATATPAASISTTVTPSAYMASTAAAAPTIGAVAVAESSSPVAPSATASPSPWGPSRAGAGVARNKVTRSAPPIL